MRLVAIAFMAGMVPMWSTVASMPVSLLTYNVKGLPWPIASARPAALDAIASQLKALRASGDQPHIVALQEAFVGDAKAIGAKAGYRYAAFGPTETANALPASAADRQFMGQGTYLLGEGVGKHADSGLAVFSDYPILAVRRIVYPVCAGYDCLANKGALAALIAVPGMRTPVVLVNTHLNSNVASSAPKDRANYAYFRQIDSLATFVSGLVRSGDPVLLARDFNVGHTVVRRAYFQDHLLAPPLGFGAVQRICSGNRDCALDNRRDVLFSERRARDWLLFRSSLLDRIAPVRLSAPFGKRSDGTMLSDHVGITVTYAVSKPAGHREFPVKLAMR